jgi:D-alanyl-D-alanine carboxypeptidase/D-alanyl-D-alanine-endopeptidase (penicillin-binding protein 4)
MIRIFLLIWLLPVCLPAQFNAEQFQARLQQIQAQKVFKNTRLGIVLADLATGKILVQEHAQENFMPASTLKLILSAAAIETYALEHGFPAVIGAETAPENGTLAGSVFLKGTGAPTILLDSLKQAVRRLKQQGLRVIDGNLVYDDFAFQKQSPRYPPFARDRWSPGGALVLNSNRIEVRITQRQPELKWAKYPDTRFARIEADLKFSDTDKPSSPDMRYEELPEADLFKINGTVTRWTERTKYLAVGATRPGLYFATVFHELLAAEGIQLRGKIERGRAPENLTVLTAVFSPPLKNLLLEMNTTSDNIIAENLFWKIGLDAVGAPVDALKAGKGMVKFVSGITAPGAFHCADGSGLSPANQISPETFIHLLIHFYQNTPEIVGVLPSEPVSTAKFDVRGKSGTLSERGLNALAGYILSKNGDRFAFVIFAHRNPNTGKLWSGTLTHPVIEALLESIL